MKGAGKKKPTKKMMPMNASIRTIGSSSKMMQAINVPVSTIIPSSYEGQQIQIVNASGATIGTVQGVLAANNQSSQVQTIQLQVVDEHPPPPPQPPVMKRLKTDEESWKFIQVTPDGQTTTYIQQK